MIDYELYCQIKDRRDRDCQRRSESAVNQPV